MTSLFAVRIERTGQPDTTVETDSLREAWRAFDNACDTHPTRVTMLYWTTTGDYEVRAECRAND